MDTTRVDRQADLDAANALVTAALVAADYEQRAGMPHPELPQRHAAVCVRAALSDTDSRCLLGLPPDHEHATYAAEIAVSHAEILNEDSNATRARLAGHDLLVDCLYRVAVMAPSAERRKKCVAALGQLARIETTGGLGARAVMPRSLYMKQTGPVPGALAALQVLTERKELPAALRGQARAELRRLAGQPTATPVSTPEGGEQGSTRLKADARQPHVTSTRRDAKPFRERMDHGVAARLLGEVPTFRLHAEINRQNLLERLKDPKPSDPLWPLRKAGKHCRDGKLDGAKVRSMIAEERARVRRTKASERSDIAAAWERAGETPARNV